MTISINFSGHERFFPTGDFKNRTERRVEREESPSNIHVHTQYLSRVSAEIKRSDSKSLVRLITLIDLIKQDALNHLNSKNLVEVEHCIDLAKEALKLIATKLWSFHGVSTNSKPLLMAPPTKPLLTAP